jgi:uncharacterized protein (DUF302 family)
MRYYFQKTLFKMGFNEAIEKVTDELKKEGFGVLTDIDLQATLKNKLDVDFRKYRIIGTCNPSFAYKALQTELHIGTLLPCNVVVMEMDDGLISVSAIDPLASMYVVGNHEIKSVAKQIRQKLKKVISNL